MPTFGHIKRKDLIRYLKKLGFIGPSSGGKHQHMKKGRITLTLPNSHRSDISRELLAKILRQVNISKDDWEGL
jgi:predicted RNA binding protein YcfA (HicA-like mRNA interferase family)